MSLLRACDKERNLGDQIQNCEFRHTKGPQDGSEAVKDILGPECCSWLCKQGKSIWSAACLCSWPPFEALDPVLNLEASEAGRPNKVEKW